MSDRSETLADIVAEMRGNEFDDPHLNADGIIGARVLAKAWAERIDAAAKREELRWAQANGELARMLDCEKAQGGNAAKLREALLFVKQYFDKIDPFNIETYTFTQIEVEHIRDAISAALAAPPRNCDRFDTYQKAVDYYRTHGGPTEGGRVRVDGKYFDSWECWLFATAAQEGGDHACE